MEELYKYPRTLHLPWSPGVGSDDKVLHDIQSWEGRDIVITEKMDGENTTMYNHHMHARSLDSKHHESRNYVKGIWGAVRYNIPDGWRVCGENLYAKHSIAYADLESYFLVFSIWNEKNICLTWDETLEYAILLNLTPVRELYRGKFNLKIIQEFHTNLNLERQEGYVIRSAGSFHYDDFSENVVKWVRKGHVQTNQHWMFEKIIPNTLKQIPEP
jgi:hypothetical protein